MRNSIGWRHILASLQGSTIERDLRSYVEPLEEINRLEDVVSRLHDHELTERVVRHEIARAQRIIEGQNFEIRKTLWRYAAVAEDHRRTMMRRRQAILIGTDVPQTWSQWADRRQALVAQVGEDSVRRAERLVTLFHIDRLWRDHLSRMADLREGIHLVRLGGHDPLTRTVAMYAALFLSPLVILWALTDRFLRKRPRRRH